MKNNDDLLSMQGNVYTLVDAEGYLVREDINGSRKRYPLNSEGGGGGIEYKQGNGIVINDDTISINEADVKDIVNQFINYESDIPGSISDANNQIGEINDEITVIKENQDDFEARISDLESSSGGGSGEGGVAYTEGEGIYISEENEINVDTDWLSERIDGYISDTDIYSRIIDLEDNAGGIGERLDDYEGRLNYIEENFDGDQIYSRLGDLEEQVGNISDVIDLINGEEI